MRKEISLDEINKQVKSLEKELNILNKNWVYEVKEACNDPKFDIYSKKGELKLDEISKKYAPLIVDVEEKLDKIKELINNLKKEDKNE